MLKWLKWLRSGNSFCHVKVSCVNLNRHYHGTRTIIKGRTSNMFSSGAHDFYENKSLWKTALKSVLHGGQRQRTLANWFHLLLEADKPNQELNIKQS